MKTKRTIGIIAVAVMGLMAATWAADTAIATEQAQNDNGKGSAQCTHDNGNCKHQSCSHRDCDNCGNRSKEKSQRRGCC